SYDPCSISALIDFTYSKSSSSILDEECPKKCDEEKILGMNTKIQQDCKDELQQAFEAPISYFDPQSYIAEVWLAVYKAIPIKKSHCLKNTTTEEQVLQYLFSLLTKKELTQSTIFFDINPPNAQLSYAVVDKSSFKNLILPSDILCGECYQSISKVWLDFLEKNPSTIDLAKKDFDGISSILKGNFSKTCKTFITNSSNSSNSEGIQYLI
ncbi:12321_t:CDS:2, partial [Ambispora gerdemannii]